MVSQQMEWHGRRRHGEKKSEQDLRFDVEQIPHFIVLFRPSNPIIHHYQAGTNMPIAVPHPTSHPVFPSLTCADVDLARTSAWYPTFQHLTISSTIIDIDLLGEREAFFEVGKTGPEVSRLSVRLMVVVGL